VREPQISHTSNLVIRRNKRHELSDLKFVLLENKHPTVKSHTETGIYVILRQILGKKMWKRSWIELVQNRINLRLLY
jgi:hypothetical protein